MNRKNNRKGFTIVELVIVIAVIAILATVLVPVFSNVITKAKESAALQEAKNIHTNYIASINYKDGDLAQTDTFYIIVEDYYVKVENGSVVEASTTDPGEDALILSEEDGEYTIDTASSNQG